MGIGKGGILLGRSTGIAAIGEPRSSGMRMSVQSIVFIAEPILHEAFCSFSSFIHASDPRIPRTAPELCLAVVWLRDAAPLPAVTGRSKYFCLLPLDIVSLRML